VYFHCSKALVRSRLWDPAHHVERSQLPSAGEILQRIIAANEGEPFDAAAYDRELPERVRATLY
jgi:hypothetical protein